MITDPQYVFRNNQKQPPEMLYEKRWKTALLESLF